RAGRAAGEAASRSLHARERLALGLGGVVGEPGLVEPLRDAQPARAFLVALQQALAHGPLEIPRGPALERVLVEPAGEEGVEPVAAHRLFEEAEEETALLIGHA